MRWFLIAALTAGGLLFAMAHTASAQTVNKPIDTNQLVVQPTDAATGIIGGTFRYVSRVAASLIDSNGYIKTFNNLFGSTTEAKATTQPGYSPLPLPGSYNSSSYRSNIAPVMPRYQVYGQTPK